MFARSFMAFLCPTTMSPQPHSTMHGRPEPDSAASSPLASRPGMSAHAAPGEGRAGATSPSEWRGLFPALEQTVHGKPLVYLDTAATSLRPRTMIDALVEFYSTVNANPAGTMHTLAQRAHGALEEARMVVADFIDASDPAEIVFTRGTTDGLNLVAAAWGGAHLKPGDEILIGIAEHASNMAPWQAIAAKTGARVACFDCDESGHVVLQDFHARLTARTRIVAFSHVSNVLGMVNPLKQLCELARAPNRIIVVDAAQSVPHFPVSVRDIGCDFLAFSSHKMLGPMGTGVLWGRHDILESMPPYQFGSNMAHDIDLDGWQLSPAALKFGAGTPNASGPVGLAAAIRLLRSIGHAALWEHEQGIVQRMLGHLSGIPSIRLLGSPSARDRIAVFSFVPGNREPLDLVRLLDAEGIAIRAGDLASLPLLRHLGARRAARASCYLYTSVDDVDHFASALERVMSVS